MKSYSIQRSRLRKQTQTWNPTIVDAYSIAAPLRNMFQEFGKSAKLYEQMMNEKSDKKSDKKQQEKLLVDLNILKDLVALFDAHPSLPLHPMVCTIQLFL